MGAVTAASGDAGLARKVSLWSTLPGFRQSLPGILALIVIAIFCGVPGIPFPFTIEALLKYIDAVLPPIHTKGLFIDLLHFNYVVIGLVAGILIRNVFGVPRSWEAGLSYSGVFMNVGIIMLGSQYMLRDLIKLGPVSIILMVIMVFGGALLFAFLGRLLKLGTSLTSLCLPRSGWSLMTSSRVASVTLMWSAPSSQRSETIPLLSACSSGESASTE